MGYKTYERMGEALMTINVSRMEHAVLLDMANAVIDGSLIYSWGHDRLARAIRKEPRSAAAKSALSQRIIPSLIAKGLICKVSDAYPGHRAEYELLVLREHETRHGSGMGSGSVVEMGSGDDESVSRVTHAISEMGSGSDGEWVAVSDGMGSAQTATPLPTSLPISATGKRTASAARRPSNRQMVFASDIAHLLDVVAEPQTSAEAADFIRENWPEIERRAHNGEPFDCSIADLSPATRRYARERGLLLNDERTIA